MFLVMQVNLASRMAEWRRGRVRFGPEVGYDLVRYGVLLSLLLIGFAWVAPTAAASGPILRLTRGFEEPWDDFLDQWNRLFAALNYQVYRSGDWFGRSIVLGGPVHLGDEPIADVQGGHGQYWRGMVYDFYTGEGWVLSESDEVVAGPEADPFSMPTFALRQVVSQTVTVYRPGNRLLIGASQPLPVVGIPARALLFFMPREGATDQLPPPDLFALYTRTRLSAGDQYWIWSTVTNADIQSLQTAGQEYPRWVTERYLQLPEALPTRVTELAEEITAPYDTPYDKVAALEGYLRTIKYNEQIPAPEPGRDGVDYFLFGIRQGYCNYYASSMAIMARAVGIPARMVAGYVGGEYVPDEDVYRIREKDSHAWAEVFFPRYGWVEFEPTSAQPIIVRREKPVAAGPSSSRPPEEDALSSLEEDKFGPEDELGEGGGPGAARTSNLLNWIAKTWRWIALAAGLALVVAGGAWFAWRRLEPRGLTSVERIYERMLRYGRLLGVPRGNGQKTPLELGRPLARQVPEASVEIEGLVSLYVRYRYGGQPLQEEEIAEATERWSRLRGPVFRALLQQMVASLQARLSSIGRALWQPLATSRPRQVPEAR